jgi:hypothetical protein
MLMRGFLQVKVRKNVELKQQQDGAARVMPFEYVAGMLRVTQRQ